MTTEQSTPRLARSGHTSHCKRCLYGLPFSQIELDSSRVAVVFYCLGSLDLLNTINTKSTEGERKIWREWLWERQASGRYGTGFRPGEFTSSAEQSEYSDYDAPHLIMTYTALLSLAILRDDFSQLDRAGIPEFLRACQREDGSFSALPTGGESDLRMVYCAFAISSMLDDWSGVNIPLALNYIRKCRSYEGGYGQQPFGEALGGTTYCALAALYLVPANTLSAPRLTPYERSNTIRWLLQTQDSFGGFSGRTGKKADACYCFWCGSSLHILGKGDLVDSTALGNYIAQCQFKFGGIGKAPAEHPDPYHTYLSLAALAVLPPAGTDDSWRLPLLDPLWNATEETVQWARAHIPASRQ